jgi:hypothetical protein
VVEFRPALQGRGYDHRLSRGSPAPEQSGAGSDHAMSLRFVDARAEQARPHPGLFGTKY